MIKKILIAVAVLLVVFIVYVILKPNAFRYESSIDIKADPSEIFPYISHLERAKEWSPYEKADPDMQRVFSGEDGKQGAKMEFSGDSNVGSGSIEILRVRPYHFVDLRLQMTKPMQSTSHIQYRLEKIDDGTRFIWSMVGENQFLFKLMGVFFDFEEMVEKKFQEGQKTLKELVESRMESR